MFSKIVLPLIGIGLLIFAVTHMWMVQRSEPPLLPPRQPPRSPFESCIAAHGLVEPQTENISLGSDLAGVVREVHVQVGKKVEAGTPLFRLDDRQLQAELKVRKADLDVTEATLKKLDNSPRPEELPASEAKVHAAEAGLADQEDIFRRTQRLVQDAAITDEELSRRQFALRVAKAKLEQAKAEDNLLRAGTWSAEKAVAVAQHHLAQARVQQTQTELERLVVCAPVDGEILQVNVRPGEYVATPHKEPLIVLGSLQKVHVRVEIDEEDIPRFKQQAKVRASVRGDPQQEFDLFFVRVEPYVVPKRSLTGGNDAERVDTRVLRVIYAIDSQAGPPLYVGQQLDVFIDTASAGRSTNR